MSNTQRRRGIAGSESYQIVATLREKRSNRAERKVIPSVRLYMNRSTKCTIFCICKYELLRIKPDPQIITCIEIIISIRIIIDTNLWNRWNRRGFRVRQECDPRSQLFCLFWCEKKLKNEGKYKCKKRNIQELIFRHREKRLFSDGAL